MQRNPVTLHPLGLMEFVLLMGLLTALDALSIDAMVPAQQLIGNEFSVSDSNQAQQIVTVFFLGMAAGQLIAGPFSDSLGRKLGIYLFVAFYAAGTLMCVVAGSFTTLLLGRALQGFGAAGPYIITMALIRDKYTGDRMARVSSFVLSIFIMVPIIAPLLGQGILAFMNWRAIFVFFLLFAGAVTIWFSLRQPETLPRKMRKPFQTRLMWKALRQIIGNRQALGYTLVEGFMFGAILAYLSTAQQVFAGLYGKGALFPLWFGGLAITIVAATVVNGSLVMLLGMRRLTLAALTCIFFASVGFLALTVIENGKPPYAWLIAYFAVILFCRGMMAGNLAALALEPLGEMAGIGATVFGTVSLLVALPIGSAIGRSFNQSMVPMVTGFLVLSAASIIAAAVIERPPRDTKRLKR